MAGDLLTRLEAKLQDAQEAEKANEQQIQLGFLRQTYEKERHRQSGGTWGSIDHSMPRISFIENGQRRELDLLYENASEIAQKLRAGKISQIQTEPREIAKLAASVCRSLDYALENYPRDYPHWRKDFAVAAIAGMYLLEQLNHPYTNQLLTEFLQKIEEGAKDPNSYSAVEGIVDEMRRLGMLDEYHSDLPSNRRTLLSFLETKLRPQTPGTAEEEFQKGLMENYGEGRSGWGEGLGLPKVSYNKGGRTESKRLNWLAASEVAKELVSGEITDVQIPPREQGKLYAAVRRSLDTLADPKPTERVGSLGTLLYTREAIAGLYLLQRLNHPQTEQLLGELLGKRPDLGRIIQRELQAYVKKE